MTFSPSRSFWERRMVLLVIEACRRSLSQWMALTIGITIFYLITSPYWPGLFKFKGYSFPRMVEILYLAGDEGMFGFLTGISSNILFIYILFASFMLFAGVGNFFINFTIWAAGWARGGAAKIAIIASALYGTVSGSTVANVYATGSFTIPLMKRSGFIPRQAAAIEAVAGTGGQIMPPIMGAGAFIMSEITGIPYFDIIKAAAIPAILYYVGLFFHRPFHFPSSGDGQHSGLRAPSPARSMLRNAYYFLPFAADRRLSGIRFFAQQVGLFRRPHHLRHEFSGPEDLDDAEKGDRYPLPRLLQCRHHRDGPRRFGNDRGHPDPHGNRPLFRKRSRAAPPTGVSSWP